MSDTLHIRPARLEGKPLKVRKHDNPRALLADDGEVVTNHKYWHRRLHDGSVELVEPPAQEQAAPKKSDKKPA